MSKVDVLSFGETMAMLVAEYTGDLAQVGQFHKRIAGADSNVAIGLARLGFNVAWLSRVGADSLGRFVLNTLQAEGLNCQHVAVDPQHPTGFQFKSRVDDGSDHFMINNGSTMRFHRLAEIGRASCRERV